MPRTTGPRTMLKTASGHLGGRLSRTSLSPQATGSQHIDLEALTSIAAHASQPGYSADESTPFNASLADIVVGERPERPLEDADPQVENNLKQMGVKVACLAWI